MDKLCWGARKKDGVHFRAKLGKKLMQRLATSPVHFPFRVSTTFPFYSILFLSSASEKKNYIYLYFMLMMYISPSPRRRRLCGFFHICISQLISCVLARPAAAERWAKGRRRLTEKGPSMNLDEYTVTAALKILSEILFIRNRSLDIKHIITCWVGACAATAHAAQFPFSHRFLATAFRSALLRRQKEFFHIVKWVM